MTTEEMLVECKIDDLRKEDLNLLNQIEKLKYAKRHHSEIISILLEQIKCLEKRIQQLEDNVYEV